MDVPFLQLSSAVASKSAENAYNLIQHFMKIYFIFFSYKVRFGDLSIFFYPKTYYPKIATNFKSFFLEHTWDKNVNQDHLFSNKRKFKRLHLASMIQYEGSYVDSLLMYSVHPLEASDINFQTIWIPKVILTKKIVTKRLFLGNILIWSML